MKIRSIHTGIHETHREAGADISPATVVATTAVVVENPHAGRGRVDDLDELEALGAESAQLLIDKCIAALQSVGLTGADVRGYGKGAIVGVDGDREHSAAILHPRFGAPVRAAIGGGADIIPGTKKLGGPGAPITMPIGNKTTDGCSTTWTLSTSPSRCAPRGRDRHRSACSVAGVPAPASQP